MKITLSVLVLMAIVLGGVTLQIQAENTMPLVGETRVMKDGAIGCDTRDAYKELRAFKDADKEDKINDLLERGVCSDLSEQQVEVVKLDLGRGGAIVVKLLEGMQTGSKFFTNPSATKSL